MNLIETKLGARFSLLPFKTDKMQLFQGSTKEKDGIVPSSSRAKERLL
jgi:hypothetical protein